MKIKLLKITILVALCQLLFTSCYTYTSVIGEGAQQQQTVTEWNHYAVYGLAPIEISDSKKMAGDAKDYTVTTTHSFITGLISALTFGLYTPTITTVKK